MALSWIYALYGNVGAGRGLFFGLKAAVLADRARGRGADRQAGARRTGVMVGIAARGLRRDLLLRRAVPADRRWRPALIGYVGGRAGLPRVPGRRRPRRAPARRRPTPTALLGERAAGACPPDLGAGAARRRRSGSRSGWRRCVLLVAALGAGNVFSQIARVLLARWRWSPSAAPTRCWPTSRSRRSSTIGWLQPGEMLDGLGMAETTPGPLIMVLQFVGFMAAFRDPGGAAAAAGRHARRPARHLGDLRAVLPLDLPRRALHRAPARQHARWRRAVGHHRGGRRRHPEPRGLVRAAHAVRATVRASRLRPDRFDVPVLASLDSLGPAARRGRNRGDVPLQGRHDPDARRMLGGRAAVLSRDRLGRLTGPHRPGRRVVIEEVSDFGRGHRVFLQLACLAVV